jgi:hypothetical protein
MVSIRYLNVTKVTAAASMVGGASWIAACFVHNSLPQGCIDEGCSDATMRGSSPLDNTLFGIAGLMLAVSGLGLLAMARRRSPLGRLGVLAASAGGLGLVLLASSAVVSAFDNDWEGMPGLVVPGILLLAVGLVLVAALIIQRRVVPFWSAALMLAAAILLPFANEQTSRILLAVPFGVAWALFGLTLLRRRAADGQASLVDQRGADSQRDRNRDATVLP